MDECWLTLAFHELTQNSYDCKIGAMATAMALAMVTTFFFPKSWPAVQVPGLSWPIIMPSTRTQLQNRPSEAGGQRSRELPQPHLDPIWTYA